MYNHTKHGVADLVVSTEESSVYNIRIYNVHQIATLFKEINCELRMAVFVSMIRFKTMHVCLQNSISNDMQHIQVYKERYFGAYKH